MAMCCLPNGAILYDTRHGTSLCPLNNRLVDALKLVRWVGAWALDHGGLGVGFRACWGLTSALAPTGT